MASPPIDPLSFIVAERSIVSSFADAQTAAANDLATTIDAFKETLTSAASSEDQFTSDLAAISATVDPAALQQTLSALNQVAAGIDTQFGALQSKIKQNNDSAKSVSAVLAGAQDTITQVNQTRTSKDKIGQYSTFMGMFRTYQTAGQTSIPLAPTGTGTGTGTGGTNTGGVTAPAAQ